MFGLGQDVLGGNALSGSSIDTIEQWDNFAKAVQTSSYQTDHANMTGLAAIRKESLEPTLRAVVADKSSFTLWNVLKRQPVTSAVHEWMSQDSRGGQADGMNIGEMGEIQFDSGNYRRHVERIKLFATGAKLTVFAEVQTLEGEQLRARENTNAMVRIANSVERGLWHANEKYSPNKINGVLAQITRFDGGRHLIDLAGSQDTNELVQTLFQIKADVRQEGNFGDVSDIYVDSYTQNSLDMNLMPQYRVQLDNNPSGLQYGAPVASIRTSYGKIGLKDSIWLDNPANTQPVIVKSKNRLPDRVPAQPTLTVTPIGAGQTGASITGWTAERAGEFYYAVALVDADGREGLPSAIVSGTVAQGGALRLNVTETPSAVEATGGRMYRSVQDPDTMPTLADLRFAGEFEITNHAAPTVVIDVNGTIPGTSHVPVLNLVPESIQWLQLRPAMQYPLWATNTLTAQWAVALFGTLQLGQPQHHYWIKNVGNKNAPWQAFKRAS